MYRFDFLLWHATVLFIQSVEYDGLPTGARNQTQGEIPLDDRDILLDALRFHGHRSWASVAEVRVGLAALRMMGLKRSGGAQLYAIPETGEEHGDMCFSESVQHTTGCILGKGNLRKQPLGKLFCRRVK